MSPSQIGFREHLMLEMKAFETGSENMET